MGKMFAGAVIFAVGAVVGAWAVDTVNKSGILDKFEEKVAKPAAAAKKASKATGAAKKAR